MRVVSGDRTADAPSPMTVVGSSSSFQNLVKRAQKVGKGDWPVLLLGETGTGKEVIAQLIHSANPGKQFVTIDCSSLVGQLMESELFGHVRGAFTGAVTDKVGLIEMADGGTAFFDEIGELPLELQAKLLRVLQEKEFRPLGSLRVKKSSFRIVAATNKDLLREVKKGTFREDLYYRLAVVTLKLIPLRNRKEDIPQLITHFLRKYGCENNMAGEVLDVFQNYDWPGNVRQLENCIQHLLAVNTGPEIRFGDLPSVLQNHVLSSKAFAATADGLSTTQAPPSTSMPPASASNALRETRMPEPVIPLEQLEELAIRNALLYTKGDRMMAAQLLRIGRTTLYRKMEKFKIDL